MGMHTVIIERCKYGALGWNVPYEFNHSDLTASVNFLQKYFYIFLPKSKINDGVDYDALQYMLCEVFYGGRITDDIDRRLMTTYGRHMLNNDIIQPGFQLAPGHALPACNRSIVEYREFLETLPIMQPPEVFGLHPNANIAFHSDMSNHIFSTILSIQPKDSLSNTKE